MKWLIVEDALRDRTGHWAEYIQTFQKGLTELGDEVTILADRDAKSFIVEGLKAKPVLPESIWHRMSDGSSAWRRYARVPAHAWKTIRCLKHWFRQNDSPDVVFVPTVLVHHLLAWYWLLKSGAVPAQSRVLLFFPNLPLYLDNTGTAHWSGGPTTKLLSILFAKLRPYVNQKRVIVAVETEPMRKALMQLTELPVLYLPHPVHMVADATSATNDTLILGSYGAARQEKGSELLQLAIAQFLEKHPHADVRFVIQWIDDFRNEHGELVQPLPALQGSGRVEFIRQYFADGEYAKTLATTSVILLPYRRDAYNVRVSRVVIEAMIQGSPVITTNQTTMSNQLEEFGAGLTFSDGSLSEFVSGLEEAVSSFTELRTQAVARQQEAQRHFSVSKFRSLLRTHIESA